MLAVSFEGAVTRFIYDDGDEFEKGTGRLKAKQFFDNLSTYNNGNGTPAEEILYSYDPFGRLVAVDNNGAETTYEYDARGQLVRTASPEGAINYEYDHLGRKTRTFTGPANDAVNDFTYEYDALGRLAKVTVVERNDIPLTEQEVTAYAYDLQGNLDLQVNPNGVIADYTYDELNRLTDLVHYLPDETPETLADNDKLAQFDYTVRDDGRRTSATETFWFDETEHVNHITWTYDDAGRLIDEVFDHYDNQHDQTQHFIYDLTGNRLERTVDLGNDMVIDQVFSSAYDANDRLITEEADTDNDNTVDQTTTYGYTGTQQTGKTVTDESTSYVTQSTTFAYDLQGRMKVVTIESLTGGVVTRRELVEYNYDHTGIRVSAKQSIDADANDVYEEVKETRFLVDHQNFTGYQQVLEEVTTDGSANVIKRIVYTLGHDNISQTVYDAANPSGQTHVFHYDGHGSTRVLADMAGAILQMYAFDAYGVALGFDPAAALTSVLYSGEQFDTRIGQQYLRARYYDAATGRFNRLDDFAGNMRDPQSLHKYLYTHADPVNGIDPAGLEFTISGLMSGLGVSSNVRSQNQSAQMSSQQFAKKTTKEVWEQLLDTFNFSEPTDPLQKKMAAAGEKLWLKRLVSMGFTGFGMQASAVGTHGPDLVAVRHNHTTGRLQVVIGEVKAISSAKVLSALDSRMDDAVQMSINWLRTYTEMIAGMLVGAISQAVDVALTSASLGTAADFVKKALDNGEFDLYLLRSRYYQNGDWKLRGYKLINLRLSGSGVNSYNDVRTVAHNPNDPIEEVYPSNGFAKQTI